MQPRKRWDQMRKEMLKSIILALGLWAPLIHPATEAAETSRQRVALMNFICDDNSVRSDQAAANLAVLIQAELANETHYDWVERVELDKAETEFNLAGWGLVDSSERLRVGKWVHADWAIFGEISSNGSTGRLMRIELVDLQRADVLAEAKVPLARNSAAFKMEAADIPDISKAIKAILDQARAKLEANRGKKVIGLLFFSDESPFDRSREPENRFRAAIAASSPGVQPFRLVQFGRAEESIGEVNLMLTGLVESDPEAWKKVADIYVWGGYSKKAAVQFNPQKMAQQSVPAYDATLNVWDGVGEPVSITVTITNQDVAEELLKKAFPEINRLLTRPSIPSGREDVRQRISDSILNNDKNLAPTIFTRGDETHDRWQWLDRICNLQAACFFNPTNMKAQELFLSARWSPDVKIHSKNEFFFRRRQSQAWKSYVEQFGLKSASGSNSNIVKGYLESAMLLQFIFRHSQYDMIRDGVPRDASAEQIHEWIKSFETEYFSRLLKAPLHGWDARSLAGFLVEGLSRNGKEFVHPTEQRKLLVDKIVSEMLKLKGDSTLNLGEDLETALKKHFNSTGESARSVEVFAELKAQSESKGSPMAPLKLPRISALEPGENGDIFAGPVPQLLPLPEANPETTLLLPATRVIVKNMTFQAGKLWLAAETSEEQRRLSDRSSERDLRPIQKKSNRLWCLDPAREEPFRVDGPLATNSVNGMLTVGDEIWLADENGIVSFNPTSGQIRRFGRSDGLASERQWSLAATKGRLFASGGTSDLLVLVSADGPTWRSFPVERGGSMGGFGENLRRIAGSGTQFLLYDGALLTWDLEHNSWMRFDQKLAANSADQSLGMTTSVCGDGNGGFWIGGERGLHFIMPATGEARSQWATRSMAIRVSSFSAGFPKLPGIADSLRPQEELLEELSRIMSARTAWLNSSRTNQNVVNPFRPQSRLPGGVLALEMDGDYLWVVTSAPAYPYQFGVLLYEPKSRVWIGGFRLVGTQPCLAVGGGKLYIASRKNDSAEIDVFDRASFVRSSSSYRVSEEIKASEIAAFLNQLTPHQQSVYYSFWGEGTNALKILSAEVETNSESLFLEALAQGAQGPSPTQESRHYFTQIMSEYPEGIFAKYINEADKSKEQHQ